MSTPSAASRVHSNAKFTSRREHAGLVALIGVRFFSSHIIIIIATVPPRVHSRLQLE